MTPPIRMMPWKILVHHLQVPTCNSSIGFYISSSFYWHFSALFFPPEAFFQKDSSHFPVTVIKHGVVVDALGYLKTVFSLCVGMLCNWIRSFLKKLEKTHVFENANITASICAWLLWFCTCYMLEYARTTFVMAADKIVVLRSVNTLFNNSWQLLSFSKNCFLFIYFYIITPSSVALSGIQ